LARFADRVARRFVAASLVAALLAFAAWSTVDPSRAFEILLAVLVISCPCALSLALPAALAATTDALARRGVLVLRADALETLAAVDTLVLDKTGTLTEAVPMIGNVSTFGGHSRETALAAAAALQTEARHPLAMAFVVAAAGTRPDPALPSSGRAPGTSPPLQGEGMGGDRVRLGAPTIAVTQRRIHAGLGVEGRIDGRDVRLGRADFAARRADDGAIWLGDGNESFARFEIKQQLRSDAPALADALRRLGVAPEIASGDGAAATAEVAQTLGIADWRARQSPEDKLARAQALQRAGRVVAMLGDGINDTPVLAGASVSFAFADGAALTHRAADFVLTGSPLARLPQSIALARRARAVVRQNLAWAVGYNALALPFAALGLIAPWLAALGMAASSLLVVLNALRLVRSDA
ncbi:MAG TPA: HAD-IC family P-type ATPase, partial [Tahibacter sp.]|uniref:heavy metal translocating P-type ATPase n=1 Tax=Tahibacter sp. TaxID=2056211 RepID=UPI002BB6DEA9